MSQTRWSVLKVLCGLVIAVISLSALTGWGTGERSLSGLRVDYIPMAPNTAISLLLLAIAVAVLPGDAAGWGRKGAVVGLAGFVAGLAGFRLVEYTFAIDLGLSNLFLKVPYERVGLAPIGQMAFFTAFNFTLASLSALLIVLARGGRLLDGAGFLGLAVMTSGLVFSLGYLYAAPLLYGGRTIPMAANTAAAFGFLGMGLIAAAGPRAFPIRPFAGPAIRAQLLRASLPFTVASILISNWFTQAASWYAAPSSMAVISAASVMIATVVAATLCWFFSKQIGGRLEQAESALRAANELLESRVTARTRDLQTAKAELEDRNEQLSRSSDEIIRIAESVRIAHQELSIAHEELKRAETQLVQSERLTSLGQMVAGVAHEINNPLAFVTNNVALLERDVAKLHELIRLYQQAEGTLEQHQVDLLSHIHSLAEQMDLAYVLDNAPALLTRSREGLKRIQKIVRDLRDFVRLDEAELSEVDLNENVKATLALLGSQASTRGVSLVADLAPLPPITCFPAKINQALVSLVTNGMDACECGGMVTVSTRPEPEFGVSLAVADTGRGIDPSIRGRIFDPFFTTKPVGQGTGLGLAICYGIVKAHGGTIEVDSTVGHGSRFTIRLPRAPRTSLSPPDTLFRAPSAIQAPRVMAAPHAP